LHMSQLMPLPLTVSCIITSHHIEETGAGLDRPLYLINKIYNITLESQNYYSNSRLLAYSNPDWFYLSGTGLYPGSSGKKGR